MQFNKYTHTHTHTQVSLIPPWEDQGEWHRMTRMTRPDCAVFINTHTHTHTKHTHTHTHCQAHNGLQVAPAGGSHDEVLATNLERATKLLDITTALLQSSDGRCSRQRRHNEYTRGEVAGLIDWLVVFAGRSRQKVREDTPEARRIRASTS